MTSSSTAEPVVVPIVPDRFAGQVVVVTGGGSGIGAAVVARVVAEGCEHVVVLDLDLAGAEEVTAGMERSSFAGMDVTDPGAVDRAFAQVVERHGRVDVVVHSAGVDDPESKRAMQAAAAAGEKLDVFRHVTTSTWRRIMAVNLDGTFHVLRAAAGAMVPRGSGVIVTISSSAAFDTLAGYAPYAASKAGAKALAQSVAKEVAQHGVRVNTIAPGPVATPMAGRVSEEVRAQLDATGARGPASADEVADSICFLASPSAANLVGAVLLTNAGRFTA